MAHKILGVKMSAPKGYLKSILEGLAIIYKIYKMPELQGSSCNSRTGKEWRRLKMLHLMKFLLQWISKVKG